MIAKFIISVAGEIYYEAGIDVEDLDDVDVLDVLVKLILESLASAKALAAPDDLYISHTKASEWIKLRDECTTAGKCTASVTGKAFKTQVLCVPLLEHRHSSD